MRWGTGKADNGYKKKFIWFPARVDYCNKWVWWESLLVKDVNYGVGVIRYLKNLDGSDFD